MNLPFEALLFDFDGVLADSEPLHYAAWMQALEPFGIWMDWSTYAAQCIGVSDRTMIERLAARRTPPVAFDDLWAIYPAKRDDLRNRLITSPGVFHPDTIELLRELARSIPLAVVSSSARSEVEAPLIHARIADCFQTMVCGHEAQRLKPAPDPYLRAAEILGVTRALVIEDSDAGVASGTAAGFEVLRIANPAELAPKLRQRLQRSIH